MTWNEYKSNVKATDPLAKEDLEEAEARASIVSAIIEKRNELGLSQRQLAEMCDMPQSSVARIESYKTSPNLDTLLKLFQSLGLNLTVTTATTK
ncbi:MAG: helix-turn-helix transcriptional regulator [Catonella sp.]|nr:helix-turn-helix transcriptional regulator [Catonella sp.]MDY6356617.1 helix-turn-helix transcriptional regulator [Catonella sp.]